MVSGIENLMNLPIAKPRLSGHETFVCRFAWLPKIVNRIGKEGDVAIFKDENTAMVSLGVGKNMVRSIRFWAEMAQVIESTKEGHRVTKFGQELLGHDGYDQFLERPETLWLIHWKISTNVQTPSPFWVQLMNHWHRSDLSVSRAVPFLESALPPGTKYSERTLSDGFKVFVNSYVPTRGRKGEIAEDHLDCPLADLCLLKIAKTSGEPLYTFNMGDKPGISPQLLAYCLVDFWLLHHPDTDHLAFGAISAAEGSPGQIFKLPELSLRHRLESLSSISDGCLQFLDSSMQEQVQGGPDAKILDNLLQSVYF